MHTIIPSLVSIETNQSVLNDFLLGQTLSFYPSSKKLPYHYTVIISRHIPSGEGPYYRIGNYKIFKDSIQYERPIIGGSGFQFSYHIKAKTFIFNEFYTYHFVNIGDIFTLGRHLFHVIESDLLHDDIYIILGGAVSKSGNTIAFFAPNGNGKTGFVLDALNRGYTYLAENYVVLQPKVNSIYGTIPIFHNKRKVSNTLLREKYLLGRLPFEFRGTLDKAYLIWPKKVHHNTKNIISNYISTYCGYYKKNNLVRSLMYYRLENIPIEEKYSLLTSYLLKKIIIIDKFSNTIL